MQNIFEPFFFGECAKFQEGIKLSKFCSNKLEESEKKVSMLLRDAEGQIREEPLPDESSKLEVES